MRQQRHRRRTRGFDADESSNAEGPVRVRRRAEKVASSHFDPNVMRELVTGERFSKVLDGLDATAPVEIAADVEADTDWLRTRWNDVMAEYAYDLRVVYLDATPEDLAVFNRTHPDVLVHTSRTTAYAEQVCDA